MPRVKLDYVVSFSSEDTENPASNLLAYEVSKKKWLCNAGEASCSVVLQLKHAVQISTVHIGAHHAALVEVLVGRSETPNEQFEVLVPSSVFLSPMDSRRGTGVERVRSFSTEQLGPARTQKWDRVRVVCSQPYNKHCKYGLSFIHIFETEDKPSESGHQPAPAVPTRIMAVGNYSSDEDDFRPGELFAKHRQSEGSKNTEAQIRQASSQALRNINDSATKLVKTPITKTNSNRANQSSDFNTSRQKDNLMYTDDDEKPHAKIDSIVKRHKDEKDQETKKKEALQNLFKKDKERANRLEKASKNFKEFLDDNEGSSKERPKDDKRRETSRENDRNKDLNNSTNKDSSRHDDRRNKDNLNNSKSQNSNDNNERNAVLNNSRNRDSFKDDRRNRDDENSSSKERPKDDKRKDASRENVRNKDLNSSTNKDSSRHDDRRNKDSVNNSRNQDRKDSNERNAVLNNSRNRDSFKDDRRNQDVENSSRSQTKADTRERDNRKRQHSDDKQKGKDVLRPGPVSGSPHTLMAGVVFALSGYENPRRARLRDSAIAMGARFERDWTPACTHLICAFPNTPKLRTVRSSSSGANCIAVLGEWIEECCEKRRMLPWQWFATEPKKKVQPPADWDDVDKTASECDTDDEIEKVLRKQKKQRTDKSPSPQPTTSRNSPQSSRERSPQPHTSRERSPQPHTSRERSPQPHTSREKSPKPHSSKEKPQTSREMSPKLSSSKKQKLSNDDRSPKDSKRLNFSNMSTDSDVAFVKDERIQANITIDSGDSTDEDKPVVKERIDKQCALPDFFDGYTFVIDDCVGDAGFDKELLSRYVKAYGGIIMDASQMEPDSEISFILSTGQGKSTNGLRVRADWVWRCHEDKLLVDVVDYTI